MPRHATIRSDQRPRVFRLLGAFALATLLAACGRCGDFPPFGANQSGACHADPQPQNRTSATPSSASTVLRDLLAGAPVAAQFLRGRLGGEADDAAR